MRVRGGIQTGCSCSPHLVRPQEDTTPIQAFLDGCVEEYLTLLETPILEVNPTPSPKLTRDAPLRRLPVGPAVQMLGPIWPGC